jgi:surfeit locus 1 family protein
VRLGAILSRRWLLTTLLALAAAVVFVRLGIWQLDRLGQRRAFNQHVTSVRGLPPLMLPGTQDLQAQEFREALVRGTYDFDHQVAIRNQVHDGEYGYHLLTPLRLEHGTSHTIGAATAVLVDRGWIPAAGNEKPEDWRKYDARGQAEIRGVIRLGQDGPVAGGLAQPTAAPGSDGNEFWFYVDIQQLARQLPYTVLPVYVQLDGTPTSAQPPIAAAPVLDLSEGPHLGYAIQWFSFAGVVVLAYPFYVLKQERGDA